MQTFFLLHANFNIFFEAAIHSIDFPKSFSITSTFSINLS